jgi:hypothetical protein
MPQRRNAPEAAFEQLAQSKGWDVDKCGWPDFLCTSPAGEIIAVEVKPRTSTGRLKLLKESQARTMDFLSARGVECFVSDGAVLERYSREQHRPAARQRKKKI